jgi:ribosomal protein S18 acetylase RimI-like enzyme
VRESGAVDALGAEHIDVVDVGQLLGCVGLERPEHHVTGVVEDDVEASALIDDAGDAGVAGVLGRDVQLHGPEVDAVLVGVVPPELQDVQVAAGHRRHGVARMLIAAARREARARGFTRIRVDVAIDNDPAQALYRTSARRRDGAGARPAAR